MSADGFESMHIIDYNGEGDWSRDAILARHACYCQELGIEPADLSPMECTDRDTKWVYPVMYKVIEGIERGDAACKKIGIEFLETDRKWTFGRILKSNTARALRRASLDEEDKQRIRKLVVHPLIVGRVAREYREYAKLLRKIGVGELRGEIEANADTFDPYVARYARYLLQP